KSRRRMPSPGMQDRSNSRMEIETSDEHRGPRQNDPDLGKFSGLCLDLDHAGVLLDDDVVADREAKTGALPARLGGEERIEHLVFHLGRYAGAVVADPDFHTITKVFRRSSDGRLVLAVIRCFHALGRRIEAVRNDVQKRAPDVLWKDI